MGEVPSEFNLAGTTTVANIQGTDAVGYAYPIDILWTNTTLAQALPNDSAIHIWKLETQDGYSTYTKSSRAGWATAAGLVIKAGQGFWVTTPALLDWEEVEPYDL